MKWHDLFMWLNLELKLNGPLINDISTLYKAMNIINVWLRYKLDKDLFLPLNI